MLLAQIPNHSWIPRWILLVMGQMPPRRKPSSFSFLLPCVSKMQVDQGRNLPHIEMRSPLAVLTLNHHSWQPFLLPCVSKIQVAQASTVHEQEGHADELR